MVVSDVAAAVDALVDALRGRRVAVLTGAGISTDSGIPDYRGPTTRHLPRQPIQHADFIASAATRRRYWARSLLGYPRLASAEPNASHHAIAELGRAGHLAGLVTQNVDSLHERAGGVDVIALHGALARVRCLQCLASTSRAELQRRLVEENPTFAESGELRADGDVAIDESRLERFSTPACLECGGVLMPDVVFFGGNVPRERTTRAFAVVDASDVLLVVGSSLTVFSGFRFARHVHATGKPLVLLTLGPTRADELATLRLDAPIGEVLPGATRALVT